MPLDQHLSLSLLLHHRTPCSPLAVAVPATSIARRNGRCSASTKSSPSNDAWWTTQHLSTTLAVVVLATQSMRCIHEHPAKTPHPQLSAQRATLRARAPASRAHGTASAGTSQGSKRGGLPLWFLAYFYWYCSRFHCELVPILASISTASDCSSSSSGLHLPGASFYRSVGDGVSALWIATQCRLQKFVRVSFRVLFSFDFWYFKAITTGEEFRKGMKLLVARASNILITTSGGYTQIPRWGLQMDSGYCFQLSCTATAFWLLLWFGRLRSRGRLLSWLILNRITRFSYSLRLLVIAIYHRLSSCL